MKIRVFGDVKVQIRTKDILRNNVVYCLTFPSGKKYVGQTTQKLDARLRVHTKDAFSKNRQDYHSAKSRAIRKYTEFSVEVLYQGDTVEELDKQEIDFITQYDTVNNGYNIHPGGLGGKGFKLSEETKKKMSKSMKGRKAPNLRPVSQYTKTGEFIQKFDSVKLAAESLNRSSTLSCVLSGIAECARGCKRRKTAYGYIWKY